MDDFPASNEGADKSGRTTRSEREENLRNLMNDEDGMTMPVIGGGHFH